MKLHKWHWCSSLSLHSHISGGPSSSTSMSSTTSPAIHHLSTLSSDHLSLFPPNRLKDWQTEWQTAKQTDADKQTIDLGHSWFQVMSKWIQPLQSTCKSSYNQWCPDWWFEGRMNIFMNRTEIWVSIFTLNPCNMNCRVLQESGPNHQQQSSWRTWVNYCLQKW